MNRDFGTTYLDELYTRIMEMGGMFNAHLHLDRAETLAPTLDIMRRSGKGGESSIAIAQKHALIPTIHDSACYDPDALERRVESCVVKMAQLGTAHAHTVVDVTPDRVGLTALDRLLQIGDRLRSSIDFRVGAYSPMGFRDDEPGRWQLIEEAARKSDFLGALPERDDKVHYPDHIGFEACCQRVIELAFTHNKPVHIHVDQKNHDRENHTETVAALVQREGFLKEGGEPFIWLIHVISPSAYDEARFQDLAAALAELNIGVICCPSAAISMRQLRPLRAPTHNSIARVLELISAGVHVRLGTDNVCDITSPAGTLDLMDELFVLANCLRYYDIELLATLGAGKPVSTGARNRVRSHLAEDRAQCATAMGHYHQV